jgi:putative N6-adenine-specific DNA methylase
MSIFKSGSRQMVVKTLAGLEDLLAEELKSFGAQEVEKGIRSVSCRGDLALEYRINLRSEFALRVLIPIERFIAKTTDELYERAMKVNWNRYMRRDHTFAIDASVHSKYFGHSKFASLRLKDAIADHFRERTGKRPSVKPDRPDIGFSLHIDQDRVTISLDSSGESLHRRGYRAAGAMAPLSEVLAAGMIRMAWDEAGPLLNPMCGSGTIAIEAARMNRRIPPQEGRTYFSFLNREDFDREIWSKEKETGLSLIRPASQTVFGSDIDLQALKSAAENLDSVGFELDVRFDKKNFFDYRSMSGQTVIMNPPYGERLVNDDMGTFYGDIANQLKREFSGCSAWIITSNLDAMKQFGLKPSKKITLFNGPLECRYQRFDLYQGSKKEGKQKEI